MIKLGRRKIVCANCRIEKNRRSDLVIGLCKKCVRFNRYYREMVERHVASGIDFCYTVEEVKSMFEYDEQINLQEEDEEG